jgi:hypothetical protein
LTHLRQNEYQSNSRRKASNAVIHIKEDSHAVEASLIPFRRSAHDWICECGNNPVDEKKWWPGELGASDEQGGSGYITVQKRLEVAKLVKRGKIALLGHPYSNHMPLVPGRTFALTIPRGGTTTYGPLSWPGEGFKQTFYDEVAFGEIGQVGTQWDGLAHPSIRITGKPGWVDGDSFYNGVRSQVVGTARGFKKMGTEKAGGFFTRGILIDVAALKGI